MLVCTELFDEISKQILCYKSDADMRSNSEIESWESYPELAKSFITYSLAHCVENVFIRESSISIFLHFLYLCFSVIKR